MELGRGFAFVDRQKHISTDTGDFYIDLVFYNIKLKRYVLFELKTHPLTHADVGQLDMYIRMYDDLVKDENDNPTIGILLCTETDKVMAKYSVLNGSEQLFAAKYMAYMPTEEELSREIEQQEDRRQWLPPDSESRGDYISQRRENNSSLKYGIDLIEGVNSNGEFQPTKALTDNINLKPYKVVRHGDIVYNPSRLNIGSLAYRTGDMCIVSHLYQVFYIKEKYQSKLSAEFLTLYLRRSEFYRYVDYDNFASQRAEYNLRKLGELLIPLPSPDEQQKVVNAWKAFREIKEQNEAKAAPLMQVCQSYIQELKHKYSLQEIGPYIEECDERNVDLSVQIGRAHV